MRTPGSNGAETLRSLRAAAVRLLAEHGYAAMNLRMLAKSVGVQAGALYNYIDSKQQLLLWLMKDATEKILAELDAAINGIEDPEAQIRAFVIFHVSYHIVNRKESSVLQSEMRSLTTKNHRILSSIQRIYTERVHAIVQRGVAAGKFRVTDSEVATFALIQMLTGVIRWYRPEGELTPEEMIRVYTEMALGMLHAHQSALAVVVEDSSLALRDAT